VADETVVALIGVGGVVVGAVGSGGVQAYLARADRRRAGRIAARLLYMQLVGAVAAIEDLRRLRNWDELITDWEAYGSVWDRHSEKLTAVLSTKKSAQVSSAFECLASLTKARARAARHPAQPIDPSDSLLASYLESVKVAERVTLDASFPWWELRTRKEAHQH
jgi:hypothetical protein